MSRRLAVAVFVLVSLAGVSSTFASGGIDVATMASWVLLAVVPAAIVRLGLRSPGYTDRSD